MREPALMGAGIVQEPADTGAEQLPPPPLLSSCTVTVPVGVPAPGAMTNTAKLTVRGVVERSRALSMPGWWMNSGLLFIR